MLIEETRLERMMIELPIAGQKMAQLVPCPYNSEHQVDAKMYLLHLTSCRVTYDGPLIQCKFNPRHWVPEPEVAYHMKMCANRQLYLRTEATLQYDPVPLQRDTERVDQGAEDGADATALQSTNDDSTADLLNLDS